MSEVRDQIVQLVDSPPIPDGGDGWCLFALTAAGRVWRWDCIKGGWQPFPLPPGCDPDLEAPTPARDPASVEAVTPSPQGA